MRFPFPTRLLGAGALAALALASACDGPGILDPRATTTTHAGFDAAAYPGDAAMAAWRVSSPYEWTGYYLPAPCHHDVTWSGTRARLTTMGWGIAVIYVGQQTWEGVPDLVPWPDARLRVDRAPAPLALSTDASPRTATTSVTCSRTLLSMDQGLSEGADAAAQTAAEGFPRGTAVFLDVEYMTTVTAEMRDYVRGWAAAMLRDGRYRPGVYVALRNADDIRAELRAAYVAAGRTDEPDIWITTSNGFSLDRQPGESGRSYASVWQGAYDRSEAWGGYAVTIDQDVAARPSPSDPR